MRSIKLTFLLILISLVSANSQDINLTELKAPTSPAFTILGIQPTEIARPTNFDAFKANLINDFTNENGFVLPQNLALEFSPYWLFSHKNLTFEKMLNENDIWNNIKRNSSISIATINVESQLDSTLTGTRLGIGYRTMLFKGSPSKKNKEKLALAVSDLEQVQLEVLRLIVPIQTLAAGAFTDFDTFIQAIPLEMDAYYNSTNLSPKLIEKTKKRVKDEIVNALKEQNNKTPLDTKSKLVTYINTTLLSEITAIDKATIKAKAKTVQDLIDVNGDNYEGFFLEFATSVAIDFNNNRFNNGRTAKWGFWLTPSYRLENEKFEFLGVVRFLKNEMLENSVSDNFDIGAKLVFDKDKLSFSGEFIQRFQYAELMDGSGNFESKNDLKAVLNIEYKLTDNILITYTFGENFDSNLEINGNVISTVGLSYNIGGSTKNIKLFD